MGDAFYILLGIVPKVQSKAVLITLSKIVKICCVFDTIWLRTLIDFYSCSSSSLAFN